MQKFIELFEEMISSRPMHLEIYYSKTLDWVIHIWRVGTGDNGSDEDIIYAQDCELDYVVKKATEALLNYRKGVFYNGKTTQGNDVLG